jgi:hypothetical protein
MRYLTPSDYSFQLRDDLLELISDGETERLPAAERAAAKQMTSKLAKRYDVEQIFFPIEEYNPALTYSEGRLLYYLVPGEETETVFQALQTVTGQDPPLVTHWQVFTQRDPLIVMYLADMAVYHFHAADAGRGLTQIVVDRYREAMRWLKAVADGDEEADLPQKPITESTADIRFGSLSAEQHRY